MIGSVFSLFLHDILTSNKRMDSNPFSILDSPSVCFMTTMSCLFFLIDKATFFVFTKNWMLHISNLMLEGKAQSSKF